MIKINLALKKQAVALDTREKGGGAGGGMKNFKIDSDALKSLFGDAQVRKIALAIVVAVMGTYLLNGYENDQLAQMDLQIQKANAQSLKVKAELAKTSGYDAAKKQLDADEKLINTKLSTIQKLSSDRQITPKIFSSLSGMIPKDVWITDFSLNASDLKIQGSSIGFDEITDFVKALGESEYLADLKLENSEKAKNTEGLNEVTFEIEAKRK